MALLVMIAIIAILAAVLLPALARADLRGFSHNMVRFVMLKTNHADSAEKPPATFLTVF